MLQNLPSCHTRTPFSLIILLPTPCLLCRHDVVEMLLPSCTTRPILQPPQAPKNGREEAQEKSHPHLDVFAGGVFRM